MQLAPFRRSLAALLPALLLFTACGDNGSDPQPVAPDQGRVRFVNAASHIAPITLKFTVDNADKASLAYGAGSAYQTIQAGSRPLQVSAGTQVALSQAISVEKDRAYTFIAAPATSTSSVTGLLVPDELTPSTNGRARIRVINLGQSLTTPIRLAQATAVGGAGVIVNDVASNTASSFQEFIPGSYSLFVSDNANNALVQVGDGSGTGTGTKNYEANKMYTVIVSGTAGSLNDNQKLKAFVLQDN